MGISNQAASFRFIRKAQRKALRLQLDVSRHVYNMALEERKLASEREEKSLGKREGYLVAKHSLA